ncbi:hypothetical protein ACTFIZ_001811 [Dictyostelium cf. discoideum]
MINRFLFLFFIFLIFNNFVSSIQPPISEYNCLKNFVTKFKLSSKFPTNSTGGYDFCSTVSCNSVSGSINGFLSLQSESTTPTVTVIGTDLSCLPFNNLNLQNFLISTTLLYTKFFTSCSTLTINSDSITSITQVLAPYDSFTIVSKKLNGALKMSYFINQKSLGITNSNSTSGYTLVNDALAENKIKLVTPLFSGLLSVPDLTGYTSLGYTSYYFSDVLVVSSLALANIKTIGAISTRLYFPSTKTIPFPTSYHNDTSFLTIQGKFTKPTALIDLSKFVNCKNIQILNYDKTFNLNGEIPIKPSPFTSIYYTDGNITKIPIGGTSLVTWSTEQSVTIKDSGLSGTLPPLSGVVPTYYDFSGNSISGTLSNTWCNTNIILTDNLMTGTLPSCIVCHLNNSEVAKKFTGNKFTNLVTSNPPCTTFAPKIKIDKPQKTIILTGIDIGTYTSSWVLNTSLSCEDGWKKVSYGSNYTCTYSTSTPLDKVSYFWIYFKTPGRNYTFPAISQVPTPNSIIVGTANSVTISGTFFSTYIGYVTQSISIGSISCTISTSSFSSVTCTLTSTPSTNTEQKLSITTNSLVKEAYISTVVGFNNNKLCPNDCTSPTRGICYMNNGTCKCNNGYIGSDCSGLQCTLPNCSNGGTCNTTVGLCVCDSSHQSSDCSLNFKQCPKGLNSLICSGGGNSCNNQTGICTCDSSHQGLNCSINFKQCPTGLNSLICSGGGNSCNNQTGICKCDSSHQGSDCGTDFIQCPLKNSFPCAGHGICNNKTGDCSCDSGFTNQDCSGYTCTSNNCNGHGTCDTSKGVCQCYPEWQDIDCQTPFKNCLDPTCANNGICKNTTGICECDPSHQGLNCSIDFKQCPTGLNSLICSGGGNSCNNQTGICNCDSSYQGEDCGTDFIKCPTQNLTPCNGFGNCNNITGSCSCDPNHQSEDCNVDYNECPIINSLICNGFDNYCNNQTGVCTCDDSHQGFDCGLDYKPCINNCSGNGICNNETSICTCDESYQGESCQFQIHQCPNNCSTGGDCDTFIGICNCYPLRINNDCSGYECLDPNCDGHGICNDMNGLCICDKGYRGENCIYVDHYASSVIPTKEEGGTVLIYGLFGEINNDPNVLIGNSNCLISNITSNSIECTIGKGSGIKDISITQNGFEWIGKSIFNYIKTKQSCPNNCNSNGICNELQGKCECNSGFTGYDCNSLSNTDLISPSTPSVNENTANGIIENGENKFEIMVITLQEKTFTNGILKQYNLENNWKLFETINDENNNIFKFKQNLTDTSEISINLEIIKKDRIINFADYSFEISKDSIKVSINISNYIYSNSLNYLQLHLKSNTYKSNKTSSNEYSCNTDSENNNAKIDSQDLENSNINHENFVTIIKDNKMLNGRYIDHVISNGISTFISSTTIEKDSNSITIGLNLPHCKNCLIDPDFSVLLSSDFKVNCNYSNSKNYIIPVSVTVSIGGAAILVGSIIFFYRKKFIENTLKIQLKRLSKNNSSGGGGGGGNTQS